MNDAPAFTPAVRAISSHHTDARLAVERTCAEVGKTISKFAPIALFVFKNDDDCPDGVGVNAYFTSLPNAPAAIRQWLARANA